MAMEITFLGTGTSQGVPVIACDCAVCKSDNPKDKRLRSSVLIQTEHTSIVIDAGPDFRQQMLRENVNRLDAVLLTHSHKDHLAGLDDIRAFNFKQKKSMDIYAREDCWSRVKLEYDYVFASKKYPGVPSVTDHVISEINTFKINELKITPILVWHYKMPVLGFRINDFTYITDANRIEAEELKKIAGSKLLVLNALQKTNHISHFTLDEAIEVASHSKIEQTYFTHISHKLGNHETENGLLPKGINLAFDGLKITI
jgi:phosphoribosyl 1,2-cyclic phosphate phosphodiesterase